MEDEIKLKEKKPVYESMFLKYEFTEEEQRGLADTLARKTHELKKVQDEKKSAAAQFKSREEAVQMEINGTARTYSDGFEMRNIECEVIFDYENGVVRHFRTDNGVMANERKMTQGERQMRFDEVEVDPVEQAEQLALAGIGIQAMSEAMEADAHTNSVNRFMSSEHSVL